MPLSFEVVLSSMLVGSLSAWITHFFSIRQSRLNVIFQEEKEALITFHSKLSIWYSEIQNVYLWEYDHRNFQKLRDVEPHLFSLFKEVISSLSRVELILRKQSIVDYANKIAETTDKLNELVLSNDDELYFLLEEEEEIVKEHSSKQLKDKYIELGLVDNYLPQNKAKKNSLKENFNKQFEEIRLELMSLNDEFIRLSRTYLR